MLRTGFDTVAYATYSPRTINLAAQAAYRETGCDKTPENGLSASKIKQSHSLKITTHYPGRLGSQLKLLLSRTQRALVLLLAIACLPAGAVEQELVLGVFAFRPKPLMERQYQPLAEYLSQAVPGVRVRMAILDQGEMETALRDNVLDLVFTNPSHYLVLRHQRRLSGAIATLVAEENGKFSSMLGGVIVTQASRGELHRLEDLKGRLIAVPGRKYLGGYQTQAYELMLAGVRLPQDARLMEVKGHDAVIQTILDGKAEVGFVRTGIIESMTREGKLDPRQLRIIHRQESADFPYVASTRLYPEWAFAALPHVDEKVVRRIAAALLNIDSDSPVAKAAKIHGFTVPADYLPVEALARALRMPPFEKAPEFTLQDIWSRFRWPIAAGIGGGVLILLLGFRLLLANRRLETEKSVVQQQADALRESEVRFRTVADYTHDWEYWLGSEQEILYMSPSCRRVTGYGREEFIDDPALLERIVHPDDRPSVESHMRDIRHQPAMVSMDFRIIRKDGAVRWVGHVCQVIYDDAGGYRGRRVSNRDITERKAAETELQIAASAFESHEGMLVTDEDRVILRVNQAFTEITGYTEADVLGKTPALLHSGRHDADFFRGMWDRISLHGRWEGEIWNRRKNGAIYPEHLTITALKGPDGRVTNYVGIFSDITHHKEAEEKIRSLAFFDPLTNLPNRRLLMDRLRQALAATARNGRKGALLFIDLDNFKTLNDTLGHDVGDVLLQHVATRLVSCVREGDTVARLGGDEFVVMLEDMNGQAIEAASQAEMIGEKILDALNEPYHLGTHEYHSTPSVGVTLFSGHEQSVDELLKQADIAMYQSKKSGRNTMRFFDPQMQASIAIRALLESDLRAALAEQQFRLYFQAQVTHRGQLVGAEVLIRWQHSGRGMVSPAEFIPLAEETGLIIPIGHWVLEAACAELKRWESLPHARGLQLAVNVSACQFHQADFVEQVLQILDSSAINPDLLKLELTESLVLGDIDDTIHKMHALRKAGVRFSMDDFGTGYSSLSSIKKLPLDQLKIDQSFVRDIATDAEDNVIVQTIIAMANNLGLEVIAEGVETEEQRCFLEKHGCPAFQGYLFSKPLPIEEFERLLVPAEKRSTILH